MTKCFGLDIKEVADRVKRRKPVGACPICGAGVIVDSLDWGPANQPVWYNYGASLTFTPCAQMVVAKGKCLKGCPATLYDVVEEDPDSAPAPKKREPAQDRGPVCGTCNHGLREHEDWDEPCKRPGCNCECFSTYGGPDCTCDLCDPFFYDDD